VIGTIVPPYESGGKDLRPLMQDICRNPEGFERQYQREHAPQW
jgi:hypothetical protein